MKSLAALVTSAVLGMVALVVGASNSASGRPASGAKSCAKGFVHATIGGQHRCLKRGQQCAKRLDRQYHRYRFHCHAGRLSGGPPPATTPAATIARVTLPGETLAGPDSVAIGEDAVWVGYHRRTFLARIDPATNRVVTTVRTPYRTCGIATGARTLWAAHCPSTEERPNEAGLSRIDTASNTLLTTIVTPGAAGPSVGLGSVWIFVHEAGRGEVWKIDLATGSVAAKIPMRDPFGLTAFAAGSAWVAGTGAVFRVDPSSHAVTTISTGSEEILSLDGDEDGLWALPAEEARVFRIHPATNAVASYRLPQAPGGSWGRGALALGGGSVWARTGERRIARLDPATGRIVSTITAGPVGTIVGALAFGFGSLWAVLPEQNQLLRITVR